MIVIRKTREPAGPHILRRRYTQDMQSSTQGSRTELTMPQAGRLWGLPVDLCESALSRLVDQGFLART